MKVLVIEDNQDFLALYKDIFKQNREVVFLESLSSLQGFLNKDNVSRFDVAVSDLKLGDGFFLDWIVQSKSSLMEEVPTIIVSSVEDIETLKSSFEWGASDYLVKPFNKNELLVKIERALKSYQVREGSFSAQDILDELTGIESKIIQKLLKNSDQYTSREKLTSHVWRKVTVNSKTLDVHLSNLRKKLQNTNWFLDCQEDKGWKLLKKS